MKLMGVFVFVFFGLFLNAARADSGGWVSLRDYMLQNVCLDVMARAMRISPLDPSCVAHRDLRVNERLPYHKSDWPGVGDFESMPTGYQRSDSYPYEDRILGLVAVQTFDFAGPGRAFDRFDIGDGGQLVAFSNNSVSIIATEDGGAGFQLMAGPNCTQKKLEPAYLLDSWIVSDRRAEMMQSGNLLTKLRIIHDEACPVAFDLSYTEWYFLAVRYRSNISGARNFQLKTLISNHFGAGSIEQADHFERFYYTRELGFTRWERWGNLEKSNNASALRNASQNFLQSGRCDLMEPPPAGDWVLVDCREWTNIVLSNAEKGDPPSFWLNRLRSKYFYW